MAQLVNPMDGLISLQDAMDKKLVEFTPGELSSDIVMHFDQPEGETRFSFAKIVNDEIQAYSVFVMAEPLNGLLCLNLGYAVPKKYRQQGLALDILEKSIKELANGLGRNNIKEFYLEAIVGTNNEASQKLAYKVISNIPQKCTDSVSGQDALSYTKLIKS